MTQDKHSRRRMLAMVGGALAMPSVLRAQATDPTVVGGTAEARRNISSFRTQRWEDHFDSLGVATLLADTQSRALHYWSADGSDYRLYPTSVPMSEELTKRGYTKVVRKRVGPDWTPTQNMLARDPSLKYMPPGPDNPLGTHALYLDWPAYLIHGTHDTRKIGRRSSSGCIGLYNEKIAELYELAPVGTQVRLI
ncbi:L,D-transpeptidase [Aliiroseovarius sp. YM-037]|uniref:L,D-transpeptidase n=1 Tax=Aliiroseovarius sp. YM-037 TaxID=3341728 RepID=UPI003A80CF32